MSTPENAPLHTSERVARGLTALLCLAVLARNLGPLSEGDEFMHLAIGRWMWEHGQLLPSPDPLVWNDRGGDMQHEWLAQLLFAGVAKVGELAAVRLLRGLMMAGAAWLVALLLRRASGQWTVALGGTALWWLAAQPNVAARPHQLAWLLTLGVFGWLLPHPGPWKPARWLVFVSTLVLWAQLHSSVVAVPLYAGLHLAWLTLRTRRVDRTWLARTVVSGLSTLLQPCGWHLYGYVRESPKVLQGLADEWAPLWQADVWAIQPWIPLIVMATILGTLWAAWREWPQTGASFPNTLPALFALWHAGDTRRMTFFLFVPLWMLARAWRPVTVVSRPWSALGLAMVPVLACAVWEQPRGDVWPVQNFMPARFPAAATVVLGEVQPVGRLFSPDPWGGFLEWHLHGRQQVAADGRMLMPRREGMEETLRIQAHAPDAEALTANLHIATLLQRRADWLRTPPLDPAKWRLAWQDPLAVLVLREGPEFAENLRRFCGFYARHPDLQGGAAWPRRLTGAPGMATPTDIPSILPLCPSPTTR